SRGEVSPRAEPGRDGYQRHLLEEEGMRFDARGRVDLGRFLWDPDEEADAAFNPAVLVGDIGDIEDELRALGEPERAVGAKAYLKSDLDFLGVDTPALRDAAKSWLQSHAEIGRDDLLMLVEALWQTPVHELRSF